MGLKAVQVKKAEVTGTKPKGKAEAKVARTNQNVANVKLIEEFELPVQKRGGSVDPRQARDQDRNTRDSRPF